MKQRFKEKCDICKTSSYFYQGYGDKIICDECIEKMKNGDFEKTKEEQKEDCIVNQEEGQMTIFDYM